MGQRVIWEPASVAFSAALKVCHSQAFAEMKLLAFLGAYPDCWRAQLVEPAQDIADFWRRPRNMLHPNWQDCSAEGWAVHPPGSGSVGWGPDVRLYGIEVLREPWEQYLNGQPVALKWRPRVSEADLKAAVETVAGGYAPGAKVSERELLAALRALLADLPRQRARAALKAYAPQLLLSRGKHGT
jgi:hypothetical protein